LPSRTTTGNWDTWVSNTSNDRFYGLKAQDKQNGVTYEYRGQDPFQPDKFIVFSSVSGVDEALLKTDFEAFLDQNLMNNEVPPFKI
jgi:hypothetical protein